jgi:hypothetical protein
VTPWSGLEFVSVGGGKKVWGGVWKRKGRARGSKRKGEGNRRKRTSMAVYRVEEK